MDALWQRQVQADPALQHRLEQLEKLRYDALRSGKIPAAVPDGQAPYTIPVVIHIVHQNGPENIPDALILQGLADLNAAFANSGYYDHNDGVYTPFQFCLARRAPDGTATTGINRVVSPLTTVEMETQDAVLKNVIRWDPTQYVNIWVVSSITSQTQGSGVAGYSTLPASHGGPFDGIVIEAQWFGASPAFSCVLVHEMGHYLGLYHTFEGGCTNDDCAKDGDRVCDTPPDQSTLSLPCGTPENSCSTDTDSGFLTDQNDMTINYMDYANLGCYNAFTAGQRDRMDFFTTNTRYSLLASEACNDPCSLPIDAGFTASAGPTVPVGTPVNFTNTSTNGATYEWLLNGAVWANTLNAAYTFNAVGMQVIQLRVQGADPNCSAVFADTIWVLCPLDASFTASQTQPVPGATVLFTNQDPNAGQFEWTVNGLVLGSDPVFSITFPGPGDYSVCLTVANNLCQQSKCDYFTVEDTIPCPSSFIQDIRTESKETLGLMELEWLSGGDLLTGGYLLTPSQNAALARLSKNGSVLQNWRLSWSLPSAYLLMELTPTGNDEAIGVLSNPEYSEGPRVNIFRFDAGNGSVLWSKDLEFDYNVSIRLAYEHPLTHRFWVCGHILRPDLPADEVVFLEIDPNTGALLTQRTYSQAEVPFGYVHTVLNDRVYIAGHLQPAPNGAQQYGVVCLDADGSIIWSKKYSWPGSGFGDLVDIQPDGNNLVLAGTIDYYRPLVLKIDQDGNVLWSRQFYSNVLSSVYANGEPAHLRVLPDGYLLSSFYTVVTNPDSIYLVLSKLDQQGNYQFSKTVPTEGHLVGIDVVSDNQYEYVLTGSFANLSAQSALYRLDLNLSIHNLCRVNQISAFTVLASNNMNGAPLSPAVQPDPVINWSTSALQLTDLPLSDTRLCEEKACTEYCNNGIDDDDDGYVDCYDVDDCPCHVDLPPCTLQVPNLPDKGIGARLAWENTDDEVNVFASPAVANLNPGQDDIPEIIVARTTDLSDPSNGQLLIFRGDGSDAASPARLDIPGGFENQDVQMPTIGDLNNDGIPELILVGSDALMRVYTGFNPAASPVMKLLSTAQTPLKGTATRPYLADFDADGFPEIYAGNDVFVFDWSNPAAPVLSKAGGSGAPYGKRAIFNPNNSASTVAADLLRPIDCGGDPDCNGLEIAAGYGIYSVDLNPLDGDPVQIKLQKNLFNLSPGQIYSDGLTAVADIDLDGIPEVLAGGRVNQSTGVYAWSKTGLVRFFPFPVSVGQVSVGMIAVGNVYDDTKSGFVKDLPEILVANNNSLLAFNLNRSDQNPAQPYWWALPTGESSGITAATSFDFNGDGRSEIVYRDESQLRILYGGPAPFPAGVDAQRNWVTLPAFSGTNEEYPVVADVDHDGQAEIVVTGGNASPGGSTVGVERGRLKVIEADPLVGPWLPTRPIWNQFNYFSVNINDNLSVPKTQQPAQVELPGLGSGKRPLNRFLGQIPLLDELFNPYLALPDAAISAEFQQCTGDSFQLKIRICNRGAAELPAGMPLRAYLGDPGQSAAELLPGAPALPENLSVDSCLEWLIAVPVEWGRTVYFVANDNGSVATPFDVASTLPLSGVVECDYSNNSASVALPPPPPSLDLGPDVGVCQNGVWVFHAGAGFESYQWSTLSTDSSITVYGPGTYRVETRDLCGNSYFDSVQVSIVQAPPIDLGPDTLICPGSSLQLQAPGFVEYQWLPPTGLSCTDCPDPVVSPDADITYVLLAKTDMGCVSADSLHVRTGVNVDTQLDTALCPGISVFWNGMNVPAGSTQSVTFNSASGCDSTVTLNVGVLPVFQTMENRTICSGDSALIFGQWQTSAGSYSALLSSANGCDSTHTVILGVLPVFQTSETRTICSGDSSQIFGQWQTAAGMYSSTLSSTAGCDSTHTVTLNVLPAFSTQETRTICSGDSTLIFGQWQTAAGTYQLPGTALNGCDSTHTILLTVLPIFQTEEIRSICSGDSSLIFGQWQTVAGVYKAVFNAANGCDSTHTVVLSVSPEIQTAENRTICSGDSTLIFSQWQTAAGTYSDTFMSAGGCDSTHTVTLAVLPVFQSSEQRVICSGDSTLIFGQWQTAAGTYVNTFTALNGCDSTHTVALGVLPVKQTSEARLLCSGDSTLIFGQWQTAAGTYADTFTAANGCDSTHTVTLSVAPVLQTTESRTICSGDSTLIFGQWQMTAGTYGNTFSATGGCDSIHTVTLIVVPAFQTAESRTICSGDSSLIFGQWQTAPGTYSNTFSSTGGCDSVHTVTLSLLPAPTATAEWHSPDCADPGPGSLVVSAASPGSAYSLDGVHYQASGLFTGLGAGNYTVYVKDVNGCIALFSGQIDTLEPLLLTLPGDTSIVLGQAVRLIPTTNGTGLSYAWTPPLGLDCIDCEMPLATPEATIQYTLSVTDSRGCTAQDRILIGVKAPDFYIANVFHPGSTGPNGLFGIQAPAIVQEVVYLRIYDRWGDQVYGQEHFAADGSTGWDGRSRGIDCPPGVYVYVVELALGNGSRLRRSGDLTLIR